ncbi:MAG: AAC(3) family N-acetyltransferase [Chloroflexota bacterium]
MAEIIRTWPGAIRSLNPGASMVAIGAEAEWMCRDHPMNYGYGSGSPLAKLIESDGKILLLGSHLDHVTILHYAEHCANLPDKRVIQRTDQVLSGNKVVDIVIEEFDTSESVVSVMPEGYFAQVTQRFVDAGYAHVDTVGQARSILLSVQKFVTFAIDEMERDFGAQPNIDDVQ